MAYGTYRVDIKFHVANVLLESNRAHTLSSARELFIYIECTYTVYTELLFSILLRWCCFFSRCLLLWFAVVTSLPSPTRRLNVKANWILWVSVIGLGFVMYHNKEEASIYLRGFFFILNINESCDEYLKMTVYAQCARKPFIVAKSPFVRRQLHQLERQTDRQVESERTPKGPCDWLKRLSAARPVWENWFADSRVNHSMPIRASLHTNYVRIEIE